MLLTLIWVKGGGGGGCGRVGGGGGGGGGGGVILRLCWFSLNNSETIKAAALVFCSIQEHFIWDIRAKFG